jgi:hypothetical protein
MMQGALAVESESRMNGGLADEMGTKGDRLK